MWVYMCMQSTISPVWLFATLWTVAHQSLCPWYFPDKNTWVGCHAFLQGIFPAQGLILRLLCLLHLASGFFTTKSTWEALVLFQQLPRQLILKNRKKFMAIFQWTGVPKGRFSVLKEWQFIDSDPLANDFNEIVNLLEILVSVVFEQILLLAHSLNNSEYPSDRFTGKV